MFLIGMRLDISLFTLLCVCVFYNIKANTHTHTHKSSVLFLSFVHRLPASVTIKRRADTNLPLSANRVALSRPSLQREWGGGIMLKGIVCVCDTGAKITTSFSRSFTRRRLRFPTYAAAAIDAHNTQTTSSCVSSHANYCVE